MASLHLAALACSGGTNDTPGLGSGGSQGVVDLGRGGGSTNNATGGSGSTCGPVDLDGCFGESFEGEPLPVDIYIMFDQSGSMVTDVGGMTRLQAVQQATAQFLQDPESAHIGVGIGYFGFLPPGKVSCDPATYANADVPISLNHQSVVSSLSARTPAGETPTAAALNAACNYATTYRNNHVGRTVVILLVTDGKPEAPVSCANGGCCPSLADAVKEASTCASAQEGIRTYVLGVGPFLDSLNQIARAGGTQSAYLVADQGAAASVLAALTAIRRDAVIPCDLELPPASSGGALDFNQVNVVYAPPGGCGYMPAPQVPSPSACTAGGGWYYDNPNAPTGVKLCPTTCGAVSQPGAALKFSIGCKTVTEVR